MTLALAEAAKNINNATARLANLMQISEVKSPCISVCTMDEASGLCLGCYRTIDEIQGWWDLDAKSQQKIVDLASQRQVKLFD